jgi:hypothetical protein
MSSTLVDPYEELKHAPYHSIAGQLVRASTPPDYRTRARLTEILEFVRGKNVRNVDLAKGLGITRTTATQYLRLLKADGMLTSWSGEKGVVWYSCTNRGLRKELT